ncbi:cytochrome P450 [Ancylothrix sp. C2]|uniref:cytochrome P450 n=1 Tax=Ancylothrix sp. D3o TaxID=2953691 RepID=UPI0021BA9F7C|nr:cytochrome P450 [Ancylothrix sp. D3o]MCT7951310.1 cytochrome P450 [Ancylothrix sp. D3o]
MDNKRLPPGELGLPVIGETLSFVFDRQYIKSKYDKYGAIFKTRLLGRPAVFLVGPEANEFVLSSGMEYFSWRSGWPETFKVLLGESLFLQDGEEHKRNRRLMMPALHGAALPRYVSTMEEITQKYLKIWEEKGEFVWFEEMKKLTFEIATVLLLGANPGAEVDRLSGLFTTLTNGLFSLLPVRLPVTGFGRAIAARNELLKHLERVVKERQENPTNDVLSLLIEARDEEGNKLSLEELTAQAMLLLFAGHETTTSMLTWLCLELGRYPEVLERARKEQKQLELMGDLSLEQLGQMSYLDQILLEIERMHPPVGGGFRGVVKPFEFNGFYVPAGWLALYSIKMTHYLPDVYPNPQNFDPDRFSLERQEHKKRPMSLVGFGGGSRICIGFAFAKLEMKIVAAYLLRNYAWEILPNQSLEVVEIPTRRPKDGLRVKFEKL